MVKGFPEAAGRSFGSVGGSLGLGHRRWVCRPGPRDIYIFSGVNSPVLGDHLTSWD